MKHLSLVRDGIGKEHEIVRFPNVQIISDLVIDPGPPGEKTDIAWPVDEVGLGDGDESCLEISDPRPSVSWIKMFS